MKRNQSSKLTFVVILAAAVAALTTVAVLLLRARARRRAMCSYNDPIDCDMGDCDCGCYDDCCCDADMAPEMEKEETAPADAAQEESTEE